MLLRHHRHLKRQLALIRPGHYSPSHGQPTAIRPFVLGRKNWLFAGPPKGAHASGTFFSLVETAKANNLEPYRYLRHVFEKVPSAETKEELCALLPNKLV